MLLEAAAWLFVALTGGNCVNMMSIPFSGSGGKAGPDSLARGGDKNMSTPGIPLPKPSLGDLLRLIGLPTKAGSDGAEEIIGTADQSVRAVVLVVDNLVSTVMETRAAADFQGIRSEVFPQYFVAMRALGDLAAIVLPRQTMERLSAEWFRELETDFRELGPSTFGLDLTERAMFTAWTLRKIRDLAQEMQSSECKGSQGKDTELAFEFAGTALWTRFHLDCLTKSMRQNRPIYPELVGPIRDGLSAAVNTYASIRQWADLRNPRTEPDFGPLEWTQGDEELLTDSMRDLEQESA